jgi:hypothetical protein
LLDPNAEDIIGADDCFPHHLWILKVNAKVIVMTAKIAKATKIAKQQKQQRM